MPFEQLKRRDLLTLLAGAHAANCYWRRNDHSADEDFALVAAAQPRDFLPILEDRAEQLVLDSWTDIWRVAHALLERDLTGRDVARILRQK